MQRFVRLLLLFVMLGAALSVGPLSTVVRAAPVVTSLLDDGTSGTLRSAIAAAAPGDTITFQSGLTGTILLDTSLGTLSLTQNVTIQGPGASVIAVDGRCATCGAGGTPSGGITVFTLTNAVTSATISGLTIQHGNGGSGGAAGGIENFGALLTVMDCTVSSNSATSGSGAGIATAGGSLIVTGSTIEGNAAARSGGGISASGGGRTLTVTNSTISGNVASGAVGNGGGGLYIDSSISMATLTNTVVKSNTATSVGGGIFSKSALTITGGMIGGPTAPDGNTAGGSGGGLYSTLGTVGSVSLALTGVTVSHNTANDPASSSGGGGISIVLLNATSTATITNSTISANTATDTPSGAGGDGGGILNNGYDFGGTSTGTSMTTITNSTITGNSAYDAGPTAHGSGGGIANLSGTLNIVNSTVSGNTANGGSGGLGGGIDNEDFLNVTGSTISGNTSINGLGGGVHLAPTANSVITTTITNSSIVGNTVTGTGTVGLGGGLYNRDVPQLTYTTIARNTASAGGGVFNSVVAAAVGSLGTIIAANTGGDCANTPPGSTPVLTSQGYNLDDDGTCSLTMVTDRSHDATPGLATALAANGSTGPLTLALLPGSNAIDHGGTSANGCPATDERGIGRPSGAACDIGAFEVASTPTQPPLPPAKPAGTTGGIVYPLPTPPSPRGSNAAGGPPAPLPLSRK